MLKKMLMEVYKIKVIDLLPGLYFFFPRIHIPDNDDTIEYN